MKAKRLYENWIKPMKYLIPLGVLYATNGKIKLIKGDVVQDE